MSTESNKAAVRRFNDAVDAGDLDGAAAVFAPQAVVHNSGAPDPLTVEGFKQFGRVFLSAFPGGTSTIQFADGKIVESWRLFDQMGMMQQLGVIPAPGQSGS
jgi:predicted ester cyclase